MENAWKVEFCNVGCSYFPQSRVECHYSMSTGHTWASHDWIGLFKVGWSSIREYDTFVWALAPTGYQEGSNVNCCVHFQACYLPKPSDQAYQFVYVDGKGEICSCSSHFTFSAPKPFEELVTVEDGSHGEEEGSDLLVVVPRAELLQTRLQECLQERVDLLQAREMADRITEKEREKNKRAREVWDRVRTALENNIAHLKDELNRTTEKMEDMMRKQAEVQASGEALAHEKNALLAQNVASEQRIIDLEENIPALTQKVVEKESELERMKERAKKLSSQRREDEKERKNLQAKLGQTEAELRSLSAEFQSLRISLAQRDTTALQLRDTITTLTHKLNATQKKEAEAEAVLIELRSLQERLSSSERSADSLRGELSALATQRDNGQTELHQVRLQAAQLTLQLADSRLTLREGRASWAQERETLQHSWEVDRERLDKLNREMQRMEEMIQQERMEREKLEVELGREKDCNRVQLCEMRRELQELKTSLRVTQKEREDLLLEKQELVDYMRLLELRLDAVADAKWSEAALLSSSRPDSSLSDSEDENPEALQPPRLSRPLAHYSLCDQPQADNLLPSTPPPSPRKVSQDDVVISQPSPHPSLSDTLPHSSDSEEDSEVVQSGEHGSGEETALLLPDHRDTMFRPPSDGPLW